MFHKYPRTPHLPWSDGISSDDKILPSTDVFEGRDVIVTEKLDGENTSLYRNHYHARSIDSESHPSRNRAKAQHAAIAQYIPEGWRICCENLYAKHSIGYTDLEGYLYGLSVWDDTNRCLAWEQTLSVFSDLNLPHPKILFQGIYVEEDIKALYDPERDYESCEGYVVRLTDSFHYEDFSASVAKYVRKAHVQSSRHWRHAPIVPNELKD